MTAAQRLAKVFELSAFARSLFEHGLRRRLPHLDEDDFRKVLLARLEKCHNRNY